MHLGRIVRFRKDNLPFPHIFSPHLLQRKGRRLTGRRPRDPYAFSLDRSNTGCRKVPVAVGPNPDIVARVDDAGFHNTADYRADEGNGEGVVDVELERRIAVVPPIVREDVQESPNKVQVLTRDVGYLKDRTDPLADKLSRRADAFLSILDEDGDFSRTRAFQYPGDLCDGLLQNMGRADVDFGDDDHDGDVEC